MRRIRRDVEFAVDSPDGLHWTWHACLTTPHGLPLGGTISGSQSVAVKACIAAIDEALSGSLRRIQPMTAH
jgi:hypothetical protein